MKQRDLANLLARAAAGLECISDKHPHDLTDEEVKELIEDLRSEIERMNEGNS